MPNFPDERKVDVYRNLNKGGFSLRSRETEDYGTVWDVRNAVIVRDARFVVNAGRERVRETGRKNVHAYVRGVTDPTEPVPTADTLRARGYREVTYNPYEHDNFVFADDQTPIHDARMVVLTDGTAFVES
ncbi:hypothetical protein [Salinibacter phage M8CRM-1]|uniref:Uncharacterized protein n=3 Tax=Kryptosalinivirus TaxID=2560163 RepID=A0A2I6UG96_9CAUD|nr:hypothetical protein FGG63_gp67 [Salinibacter phage M8CC-19]YP_009639533.1 hypothetical protein FGG67_gp67 [Salinibacter phage M8CRM-1]AUO78990.1 hypothetical protein [Salinibacter phage M8CC-19]AUO79150.1 hypothetical protein [Salinibacter phage M8CRM-1]AUO79225.1 hypothetical protein [Salinibacter phage M31CC-1]